MVIVVLLKQTKMELQPSEETIPSENANADITTNQVNPASKYCEENDGVLEIVTIPDGSQFALCKFDQYACEEWTFYRGNCTVEEDEEKIFQALKAKGLNLADMKVVIYKHLGKYISGGVVPVSTLGGGGYVFAVKDEVGAIEIVADGNGAIMCAMLDNYPDYPSFLIPECIDEKGMSVVR